MKNNSWTQETQNDRQDTFFKKKKEHQTKVYHIQINVEKS